MAGATAAYFQALRGGRSAEAVKVGVSKGVSMCLSVFIAMALSRMMEPEAYGTYLQVLYVYGTLLVLFSLGLPSCYSYFLARTAPGEGRAVVLKLTVMSIAMGCVFSLTLFVFSDGLAGLLGNAALGPCLRLFSVVPVAMMPVAGVEGVLMACRRSGQLALYVCMSRLLTLLCVVCAARMCGGSPQAVTGAFAAASVVSAAWGLWLSYRPFIGVAQSGSGPGYGDFLRFALPVFYAGIYGFVISSSSQFFVSRYFGAGDFAVFSNGFREMPLALVVMSAVGAVLLPELSRLSMTDREECIGLWRRSVYKSAMVVWPVAVFCMVFAPEIMTTLFGESYRCGAVLFRLSSLICFVLVVPFFPLMTALGLSRGFARAHLVTAVALVGLDWLAVMYFPSLTVIAAVSVFTRIMCVVSLLLMVSGATGLSVAQLLPLRLVWRLLPVSGVLCCMAKAVTALCGIESAPLTLAVALAVAVPAYLLLSRVFTDENHEEHEIGESVPEAPETMPESSLPAVSVIVACYNSEKTIGAMIESVLSQSYTDWELIITDDGSTDGTPGVIRQYAARDSRIIAMRTDIHYGGPSEARNMGLDRALGQYIAFLDSDDLWLPDKLRVQMDFIEANGYDFVYSYYEKISGGNSRSGRIVATKKMVGYNDILKSNHIPFLTAIIKRSVVGNTRFKDITQEDFCFWLDILKKGVTAHNQCVVTALYRVSKGSRSSNKFKMAHCYWHVIRHHQRTGLALSCRCMVTYAVEGLRKYMI